MNENFNDFDEDIFKYLFKFTDKVILGGFIGLRQMLYKNRKYQIMFNISNFNGEIISQAIDSNFFS